MPGRDSNHNKDTLLHIGSIGLINVLTVCLCPIPNSTVGVDDLVSKASPKAPTTPLMYPGKSPLMMTPGARRRLEAAQADKSPLKAIPERSPMESRKSF